MGEPKTATAQKSESYTDIALPPVSERPLVTFMLIAYNQERFIREAVEGAFAQTYTPLEIILSDDCSTDRTFEIMKEMAAQYKGPHKIILNRNERNLGICGHVNRCIELTHGELIVCAAGDDISLPHRCTRLVIEWMKPHRNWHSICSGVIVIDNNGIAITNDNECSGGKSVFKSRDEVMANVISGVYGCAHAFSRRNYDVFGPLDPKGWGEDDSLGVRSALLGGIIFIPDKLVKYRRHDSNSFVSNKEVYRIEKSRRRLLIKKHLDDCRRGYNEGIKTLSLALNKNIISTYEYKKYTSFLNYRYPLIEYSLVDLKKGMLVSLITIFLRLINGSYRPGMFSLWEELFLSEYMKRFLRKIRGK